MRNLLNFSIFKYILILINILLFSQSEIEARSKMMVLSCSKLLNQKHLEKSETETISKMMLSCFMKITQDEAQKIFNAKEDSIPLKSKEIEELLNTNNLKDFSKEKIKFNKDLLDKFLKEIGHSSVRNLEEVDNAEKEANKDNSGDDNKDDLNINDDAETADDKNDDNDNEFNDMDNDDPNYYGEDLHDEDMYDGGYDDYDDYYDDYYGYGNYSNENYSDDDYSSNYDNQEYYDDDDKPWRVLIKENKGLVIFICCLVVMVILIAIFGKDYEEPQQVEIDPNKNKNE
jgi:hypothetical protein